MTLVPSRVDHSSDILSSARNLQKKDFQLRSLRAGVWDLGDTEAHPPEECQWVKSVNPADTESVIGEDERVVVPPADFVEGGKYRCKSTQVTDPQALLHPEQSISHRQNLRPVRIFWKGVGHGNGVVDPP